MAMRLFRIERQHLVCVLTRFDQLAEPKVRVHGDVVSENQEIRVVLRLGSVQYLPYPANRLGHRSRSQHVGPESEEYRDQCIVAA
jgi:hypothetical protein